MISAPADAAPPVGPFVLSPGAAPADPYALVPGAVETPPVSLPSALRRIGPGMVLAASIVGSGEVIATTTLGAQVGFAALWIVLVSCAIKPVVQGELGRYTIATGRTGLEGFNRVPGPRLGVSWLVWAWVLTVSLTLLQVGGMYGGVGQVLHLLVPAVRRQRLGRHLPGDHAGGAARRRLLAHRAACDRQGRTLHGADGVRGRGAAAASRRRVGGAT